MSCGQCIGCRLEKSRQWAVRCVHEAQLHKHNCYITLTYNDQHVPIDNSLNHRDFQLFMKRLRKRYEPKIIRYYMAGEYGERNQRPHFHACIFNHDFDDKKYLRKTPSGNILYTSPTLEQIWTQGYSSIGTLTFESAAYIARYIMKKITGVNQQKHYEKLDEKTGEIKRKEPEYNNMSRRPGIGQNWLRKYKTDIYPQGTLIINGHKARPPRYYDQEYKKSNPMQYKALISKRHKEAIAALDDNDNSRLDAKHQVKQAQLSKLKRKL